MSVGSVRSKGSRGGVGRKKGGGGDKGGGNKKRIGGSVEPFAHHNPLVTKHNEYLFCATFNPQGERLSLFLFLVFLFVAFLRAFLFCFAFWVGLVGLSFFLCCLRVVPGKGNRRFRSATFPK